MQKMEWIAFGFDLDLIWIEIGVFLKILRKLLALPVMGTIFLVYIAIVLLYIYTSNKKIFTSK